MNKVYTKATGRLIKLFDEYKGVKFPYSGLYHVNYFDNTNSAHETGFLTASLLGNYHYIAEGYKEVTEQEFIDIIGFEQSVETGVKESIDKLPYELDWAFIEQMAERMNANKGKYARDNWKKPIDLQSLKDGLARHFVEIQKGNYEDDGRELGHLEAIACNIMMINYQIKLQNTK